MSANCSRSRIPFRLLAALALILVYAAQGAPAFSRASLLVRHATQTPVASSSPASLAIAVPPAAEAPATIALRSIATSSTQMGGGSQLTIAVPSGAAVNDVMVAQMTVRGGSTTALGGPAG
ncbi:MAG TPA: hypothetical protein VF133_09275, partial [Terriglobales bacterium]